MLHNARFRVPSDRHGEWIVQIVVSGMHSPKGRHPERSEGSAPLDTREAHPPQPVLSPIDQASASPQNDGLVGGVERIFCVRRSTPFDGLEVSLE